MTLDRPAPGRVLGERHQIREVLGRGGMGEELAALRTHTNLRTVPDPASATGYKLEPGPFPGWAKPPQW